MLILIIFIIGFYTVISNLFYVFSLHWLLEIIINLREGESMQGKVDDNLTEIVENDEEIANAIVDTENDMDEEAEQLSAAQSNADNWKSDKIKERKKLLKALEQQYENCLQCDKYSNDEDRVKFEESKKIMAKTISILSIKEGENFMSNYIRDLKRAFSRKIKENPSQVLEEETDRNFENSKV